MKNLTSNNRLKSIVKSVLFLTLLIVSQRQAQAQFVLEPFVSNDDFILESWYFKTIDESKRFSVFALNEAKFNFDTDQSTVLSYGLVGFDWKGGFGPVTGWRASENGTAALAGFQYGVYRENFLAYMTVNREVKSDPNYEFYSLIQYRKPINEKLKGFSQLQISKNFQDNNHTFSLYRLRLGLDLGKFQTGIGIEQNMIGEGWDHKINAGLFVRMELY